MDDTVVIVKLKRFVEFSKSQKEAAARLGISTQYLNDLLRGRRCVSEKIAREFGFTAQWIGDDENERNP